MFLLNFFANVWRELVKKVAWPGADELERLSGFFFTALVFCVLAVGFLNFFCEKVMSWIYVKFS